MSYLISLAVAALPLVVFFLWDRRKSKKADRDLQLAHDQFLSAAVGAAPPGEIVAIQYEITVPYWLFRFGVTLGLPGSVSTIRRQFSAPDQGDFEESA